jgi:hypothetical protein
MAWDGTQIALALTGVAGVLTALGGVIVKLRQGRDTETKDLQEQARRLRGTNQKLRDCVDMLDAYIYRIRKRLREHGEEPEPLPARDDDL